MSETTSATSKLENLRGCLASLLTEPRYTLEVQKNLYFQPDIVKERLKRAPYAQLHPGECPLLVLDASDSTGIKGIVCTDNGIHYSYSIDDRAMVGRRTTILDSVLWSEMTIFECRDGRLMCNGKILVPCNCNSTVISPEASAFAGFVISELARNCVATFEAHETTQPTLPAITAEQLGETINTASLPLIIYFHKFDDAHNRFKWFAEELFNNYSFSRRCKVVTLDVSNHPEIVHKFAFTYLPAGRAFHRGLMMGGRGIGDHGRPVTELLEGTLAQVKQIASNPTQASGGTKYSDIEIKSKEVAKIEKAKRAGQTGDQWLMLPMSGLIAGIAGAISFENIHSAGWMLPAAIAWGVCILNRGFRFNLLQKVIATIIMLYITFEWRQLARLFMNH